MLAIVVAFGQGLGLAALIVFLYSELLRQVRVGSFLRDVMGGAVFALGAMLAMATPVVLAPGVFVDSRHVLVGLASAALGPVGGLVTVAATAVTRLLIGGEGAPAGIATIVAAALIGTAFRAFRPHRDRDMSLRDLAVLGCLLPLVLLASALLPGSSARMVGEHLLGYVLATTAGVVIFGLLLVREQARIRDEQDARRSAVLDPLTNLYNRRGFDRAYELAWDTNAGRDLSVLLIDIDFFKDVNDTHGHDAGDRLLLAVADALRSAVRRGDIVARVGGDEFCVVLPVSAMEAEDIGARIRRSVLTYTEQAGFPIGVSVGVAGKDAGMADRAKLLRLADDRLYEHKRARPAQARMQIA